LTCEQSDQRGGRSEENTPNPSSQVSNVYLEESKQKNQQSFFEEDKNRRGHLKHHYPIELSIMMEMFCNYTVQ
jgi:hypothetical protein